MGIRVNTSRTRKALGKLAKGFDQALVNASHEAGLYLESEIKQKWPTSSGQSSKQISTETKIANKEVKTTIGSSVKTPWAIIVEEGRKPGGKLPNLGAISKFIARTPSLQNGLKSMFNKSPDSILVSDSFDSLDSKQKSMVFVVARAIARNGIKARWIFKNVRKRKMRTARKIIINKLTKFFV